MTQVDLFSGHHPTKGNREEISPGAILLRGYAQTEALYAALHMIIPKAPFRHMETPGGKPMSAAMTNCGPLGWVSDRRGYRYSPTDPTTSLAWPTMPELFSQMATQAAKEAGFEGFMPDACLINRYAPGARLTLHQDKNEKDFRQPVVTVSLGLPATFLLGGENRSDKSQQIPLFDGDIVILGGPSRLYYHGVKPIQDGWHPVTGAARLCLTFRKAG